MRYTNPYKKHDLWIASLVIFVAVVMLIASAPCEAQTKPETAPLDPVKIMEKIDDLWRGTSSEASVTMNIKTKHWERSLTMKIWSLGKDNSVVKVEKPMKERGTATLMVEKEIYNYLPKTDRTIKLTSAMMGGSWMGSHFTNDDLVKENRTSEDFDSKITYTGDRGGTDVIEVTSVPKPNAAVVWGKIVTRVRSKDWQPLEIAYFDEEGVQVRKMVLSDHRVVSDRLIPMKMKVIPEDKPNEFTEIVYNDIKFDIGLKKSFFSLNQLRR